MFRNLCVRNGGATTLRHGVVRGERRRQLQEVIGAHVSMHLKKGFHERDLDEGGGNRQQCQSSKNPPAKVPPRHHNPRRTAYNLPPQHPGRCRRRRPVVLLVVIIIMKVGVGNHVITAAIFMLPRSAPRLGHRGGRQRRLAAGVATRIILSAGGRHLNGGGEEM